MAQPKGKRLVTEADLEAAVLVRDAGRVSGSASKLDLQPGSYYTASPGGFKDALMNNPQPFAVGTDIQDLFELTPGQAAANGVELGGDGTFGDGHLNKLHDAAIFKVIYTDIDNVPMEFQTEIAISLDWTGEEGQEAVPPNYLDPGFLFFVIVTGKLQTTDYCIFLPVRLSEISSTGFFGNTRYHDPSAASLLPFNAFASFNGSADYFFRFNFNFQNSVGEALRSAQGFESIAFEGFGVLFRNKESVSHIRLSAGHSETKEIHYL